MSFSTAPYFASTVLQTSFKAVNTHPTPGLALSSQCCGRGSGGRKAEVVSSGGGCEQHVHCVPLSTVTVTALSGNSPQGSSGEKAVYILSPFFYLNIISSLQKTGENHQTRLQNPVPLRGLPLSQWSPRSPRTALP